MNWKMLSTALGALFVITSAVVPQNATVNRADNANQEDARPHRNTFFNWTKERLGEIDATLALWEGEAAKLQGEVRPKAEHILADMRARRDAFRETLKRGAELTEASWNREQAAREADWKRFEASVKEYIEETNPQAAQQKAAFQARVEAQKKAWKETIEKLQVDAAKATAEGKAKTDEAVKQMKADAEAAKAKLEKLASAKAEPWSAYEKALSDSRAAFDRAVHKARDVFPK